MLPIRNYGAREADGESKPGPVPGSGPSISAPWENPKLTVETVDNHIYFYSNVNSDRGLALMRQVRETDNRLRSEQVSRDTAVSVPIWLHVHSYGGDLMTAFSLADQLASIRTPIYSVVEGCVASAGTLITMPCRKRYITPNSFFLIHQLSSVLWGKYEENKDGMHLDDMLMDRLVKFYTENSRNRLDEKKIRDLLQRDSWFDSEQCVQLGFVDAVKLPSGLLIGTASPTSSNEA